MSNHLKDQSSPYLLQHAENPVNWYPWTQEAFDKAIRENKPFKHRIQHLPLVPCNGTGEFRKPADCTDFKPKLHIH